MRNFYYRLDGLKPSNRFLLTEKFIMGLFDFLKSKSKSDLKNESKEFTLDNITLLIDLTLNTDDSNKLKSFLNDKINSQRLDRVIPNEMDEFHNQEIIDFMANEAIYFYGFFDWKEDSKEFDFYIRNALKRNYKIDFPNTSICDLDELKSIDKVYKIYGKILEKYNISLCNIDIDSDSYQIILVKNEDYDKIIKPTKELGFKLEHYTEEW